MAGVETVTDMSDSVDGVAEQAPETWDDVDLTLEGVNATDTFFGDGALDRANADIDRWTRRDGYEPETGEALTPTERSFQGQGHTEDPRIEAVAIARFKIVNEEDDDPDYPLDWETGVGNSIKRNYREEARVVLAAADAADPRVAQLANLERELIRSREAGIRMVSEACAERDSLRGALTAIGDAIEGNDHGSLLTTTRIRKILAKAIPAAVCTCGGRPDEIGGADHRPGCAAALVGSEQQ